MSRPDVTSIPQRPATEAQFDLRKTWFDDDDEEWEYEYDEDETEDFYLTLDLTTHLPDALSKREAAPNGTVTKGPLDLRLKEFKRMNKTPADLQKTQQAAQHHDSQNTYQASEATVVSREQDEPISEPNEPRQSSADAATADKLQLIGLHTTNPYIMFNNKFYTSYWLTDLGTQIWVTRPGVSETAAWSGNVLDVVNFSRARLLAKPAKLEPKYDNDTSAEAIGEVTRSLINVPPTTTQNPIDLDGPVQPLAIPTSGITDPLLQAQASFMERLSVLKIKRGEQDQVPLYSVKAYEYPENAAEVRAQAWDAEDAERARLEGTDDLSMPRLIREPNQPGRKYSKPGSRAGMKSGGRRPPAGASSSKAAEDSDTEDGDANGSSRADSHALAYQSRSASPIEEGTQLQKRGPKKRSAKLAALGLTSQGSGSGKSPAVKKTRRTKAQMEAARAADAAFKAQQKTSVEAEHAT